MELLSGYGSDSGSEPASPVQKMAAPPPDVIPAFTTAPGAVSDPNLRTQEESVGAALLSLPQPASQLAPLFSGLPMPVVRRKRLVAKFSCPINYGDAKTTDNDDADDDGDDDESAVQAAKRMKRGTRGSSLSSIADFLPPPKNATASSKTLIEESDKIGDDWEDYELVPGAEDPSAMHLGGGGDGGLEGEDDMNKGALPPPPATATITTEPNPRHIRSEYNGQEYLYDTVTAQYYYPEAAAAAADQQQPVQQDDATAAMLAAVAQSGDPSTSMHGGGAFTFKEVSGAQLRYMAPGQRAELTALRSALGDDYEARLKSDASKVGAVSKTAKRKHQLSSLYVQAKEQELDDMEKRATGAKTKSETQRKYGW